MRHFKVLRAPGTSAAILVILVAVAGSAVAAQRVTTVKPPQIVACAGRDGTLVLARRGICAKGQRRLAWNQRGVAGLPGQPGLPGTNGANGRDGVDGAVGPAGPTESGFAVRSTPLGSIGTVFPGAEMVRLGSAEGTGLLTVGAPSRLTISAAIELVKTGNTATEASVTCTVQVASNGGGFTLIGRLTRHTIYAAPNPVNATIPVAGAVDVPAGTHDVRVVCFNGTPAAAVNVGQVGGTLTAVAAAT